MFGTASRRNHEHVRRFGAQPIDYRTEDFVQRLRAEGQVRAVFDGVGGRNLFRSYRCLLPGGTLVFYGMTSALSGGRRTVLSAARTVAYVLGNYALNLWPDGRKVTLYSIQMRKRRHPADYRNDLGHVLQLLSEEKISPVIAHTFDLTEAARAHELFATKSFPGKIVLTT
jgi:NADPH:quinone reductase-like Zn-dependent oxidoreductase